MRMDNVSSELIVARPDINANELWRIQELDPYTLVGIMYTYLTA